MQGKYPINYLFQHRNTIIIATTYFVTSIVIRMVVITQPNFVYNRCTLAQFRERNQTSIRTGLIVNVDRQFNMCVALPIFLPLFWSGNL